MSSRRPFNSVKRLLLSPDTWERHFLVGQLARGSNTVLDIGGVAGQLALFLPGAQITSLNLDSEHADVHFDGLRVPYADNSFEVVVSLDVLEHIEKSKRGLHLAELARVADRRIILCCPLGAAEHVDAERELSRWYREVVGSGHRFLEEHLERGLPNEREIEELVSAAAISAELYFHGDFRCANRAFRLGTLARHRPSPGALVAYARTRFAPRRDQRLAPRSTQWSNRVFVIADLR